MFSSKNKYFEVSWVVECLRWSKVFIKSKNDGEIDAVALLSPMPKIFYTLYWGETNWVSASDAMLGLEVFCFLTGWTLRQRKLKSLSENQRKTCNDGKYNWLDYLRCNVMWAYIPKIYSFPTPNTVIFDQVILALTALTLLDNCFAYKYNFFCFGYDGSFS